MKRVFVIERGRAIPVPTKVCRDCGEEKLLMWEFFKPRFKNGATPGRGQGNGWSPRCRLCDLKREAAHTG